MGKVQKSSAFQNAKPTSGTPFFTIQFINDSKIAKASDFFFVAKGLDPNNATTDGTKNGPTLESFLKFNSGTGEGSFVPASGPGQTPPSISLGDLTPKPLPDGTTVFELKLPKVSAGRMFISLQRPLPLSVVEGNNGDLTIVEDDPYRKGVVSFATIYDKLEFSFDNIGIWINTTAVDFFSIPLGLKMDGVSSGLTTSRNTVIQEFETGIQSLISVDSLNSNGQLLVPDWNKCIVEQAGTVLRIIAPNKAIGRSDTTENFNTNYLKDYIDAVWSFYAQPGNEIGVNCKELVSPPPPANPIILNDISSNGGRLQSSEDSFIFFGSVNEDGKMVFRNKNGDTLPPLDKPASNGVFGGHDNTKDSNFVPKKNTALSVMIREVASAMNVGLLPLNKINGETPVLDKEFFIAQHSDFYRNNPLLPTKTINSGSWYNVYSKLLLRAFPDGEDPKLYTYAFDDTLGLDGTLSTANIDNPPVCTVTIGDMTGTKLPQPDNDTTNYTISFLAGNEGVGAYVAADGIETAISNLTNPNKIADIKSPFSLKYGFEGETQTEFKVTMLTEVIDPELGVNLEMVSDDGNGNQEWNLFLPGKSKDQQ